MNSKLTTLGIVFVVLATFGCAYDTSTIDAMEDANNNPADGGQVSGDAGTTDDAGQTTDAGIVPDAGQVNDAGTTSDSGNADDASNTVDAGTTDDAGATPDAGTVTDAGNSPNFCDDKVVYLVAKSGTAGCAKYDDVGQKVGDISQAEISSANGGWVIVTGVCSVACDQTPDQCGGKYPNDWQAPGCDTLPKGGHGCTFDNRCVPPPAEIDGGVEDAGSVNDSGTADAGQTIDAGVSDDAGTTTDAGTTVDAGTADAGQTDAGQPECVSNSECYIPNLCTQDVCVSGSCQNQPGSWIDDHDICTVDTCDPVDGVKHTGIPGCKSCQNSTGCDDSNACTTDTCPVGACNYAAVPCNAGYTCDPNVGCVQDIQPGCQKDADCASDNPTQVGKCATGVCSYTFVCPGVGFKPAPGTSRCEGWGTGSAPAYTVYLNQQGWVVDAAGNAGWMFATGSCSVVCYDGANGARVTPLFCSGIYPEPTWWTVGCSHLSGHPLDQNVGGCAMDHQCLDALTIHTDARPQ